MKILLAYSSKTKNTKKVAEAIYEQIKDQGEVDLLDIKKQRKKLEKEYDFYILGAWTDKTNANKNMQRFIDQQEIHSKDVALFLMIQSIIISPLWKKETIEFTKLSSAKARLIQRL